MFYASHFILETDQETIWSHIVKEFKSSNSKITADTDQNISLPLYSKIYTWYYNQLADACPT